MKLSVIVAASKYMYGFRVLLKQRYKQWAPLNDESISDSNDWIYLFVVVTASLLMSASFPP